MHDSLVAYIGASPAPSLLVDEYECKQRCDGNQLKSIPTNQITKLLTLNSTMSCRCSLLASADGALLFIRWKNMPVDFETNAFADSFISLPTEGRLFEVEGHTRP